ncbi:7dc2163e-8181-42e4-a0cb-84f625744151 [Sclerotinia trifoliorum]|uniref:7dc2163e-8181-42e4-a0cb-84f625744151 n=1 Tax=Sclerotinia trifoliorum TaxID=28548 RepID=A0A8H2VYG4_9HELO|nr:7dc2163e-8181-42e4-a0cb-84f625744151 [Sclerotinia trifoliorum]
MLSIRPTFPCELKFFYVYLTTEKNRTKLWEASEAEGVVYIWSGKNRIGIHLNSAYNMTIKTIHVLFHCVFSSLTIITLTHSNIQLSTSTFTIASISKNLRLLANIFNQHAEKRTLHSPLEMAHFLHKHGWEQDIPNPCVPFATQPTFVVQFKFWVSSLKSYIKDPEPYLPGRVHDLQRPYGSIAGRTLFHAFHSNGITNCTQDGGSDETSSHKNDPQHPLCRGLPSISALFEPWIPLWQIDEINVRTERKPMNIQRYDLSYMHVISPVLPLTEESYQEVDRVADTICQTLRVQNERGPGFNVRCESRTNFEWSSTQHCVPKDLKYTLEKRFSRVPQVDKRKRASYADRMFEELITTGPQPRGR